MNQGACVELRDATAISHATGPRMKRRLPSFNIKR
ncbi:hypothetical protein STPYR_10662 [uncultured Stenotrophomonas sp.]|uniref:Uncharacterized protein n=1 Tax=uncultured Stenotrophomonas sp. TaxID=165438 RepID=A0A1Y5Q0B8_9GAMM|nr:hypothetical protein STPYR_10662 [uncultured Stenotrophomonas sp.]